MLVLDQGNGLVRAPLLFGLGVDVRQGVIAAQGGFQRQHTGHGLIQPLVGQAAISHRVQNIGDVFPDVGAEAEHVAPGGDAVGNGLPAGHGHGVAAHDGGVGDDDPVEPKLIPQHAGE